MARRRRKRRNPGNGAEKPPLVFLDSPVDGGWPGVSPASCASQPTTADVVPVDPEHGFPWISPHFGRQLAPSGDHRRRSRRLRRRADGHSPVAPRRVSNRNASLAALRRACNPKTVRLRFIGESTSSSVLPPSDQSENEPPAAVECVTPTDLRGSGGTNVDVPRSTMGPRCGTQKRRRKSPNVRARRLFDAGKAMAAEASEVDFEERSSGNRLPEISALETAASPRLANHSINMTTDHFIPQMTNIENSIRYCRKLFAYGSPYPRQRARPTPKVLVCDTPLANYGLPVRLRRLKKEQRNVQR